MIRWIRTAKMQWTIIVVLQANNIEKPGFGSVRDPFFIIIFFGQDFKIPRNSEDAAMVAFSTV